MKKEFGPDYASIDDPDFIPRYRARCHCGAVQYEVDADLENKNVIVKGLAWFWHTAADTIDKIDPEILLRDAKIYTAVLWRLCTDQVLPMNFVDVAEELIRLIQGLQQKAAASFDLAPAMEKAKKLRGKARQLHQKIFEFKRKVKQKKDKSDHGAIMLDHCLMKLSRILMPINYSSVDPYDFDPALSVQPLPRLQPVAELADLNPAGDAFKFLERKMIRERNRLCHALEEAHELIAETLNRCG